MAAREEKLRWWWIFIRGGAAVCIVMTGPCAYAKQTATVEQEQRIGACIRQSSQGRQWLEDTLWAIREQEAGWIGAEVRNTNGTHDLGPMQINSWWVPRIAALVGRDRAEIRSRLIHDACFNVQVARWIFLTGLATTGEFWKSVGIYHSPTPSRQQRYAREVATKLHKRFGNRASRRTTAAVASR
ncbi:lytic transglycosylase domain-containing protein [Novosphingobium kaempferiae]|uniref:lytic transglycosylase domain-containing protein n=1 Tax=Novosphingobium kaempferiae TaxID=2896849 RepID=UPI001E2F35C5|nr:lytic transglycosylase domain-containing protein [Novosphingobium kaempferiae]